CHVSETSVSAGPAAFGKEGNVAGEELALGEALGVEALVTRVGVLAVPAGVKYSGSDVALVAVGAAAGRDWPGSRDQGPPVILPLMGGIGFGAGFFGSIGFGSGSASGNGGRFSANGGKLSNNGVPVGGPTGAPPCGFCPAG